MAVTGDTKRFRIYVDAQEIVNSAWEEMDGENEFYYLGWGGASGGEGYAGQYDEVAVFAETLSQEDLDTLMTIGVRLFAAVTSSGKLTTTWGALKI